MAAAEPVPTLDRDKFTEILSLQALLVHASKCQHFVKLLRGHTLDMPRQRAVVKDPEDPQMRLLLLKEGTAADLSQLPQNLAEEVRQADVAVTTYDLKLDYSYWPADQILKKLLPEGVEVPSSFETVGHIAHLNIREELEPYKHVIGQVIIDKNPHITTVVNKVGTITNEFRVFQMEVVAGEPKFETEVVQYKASFRLDFSKVYWNSRLENEHSRLVKTFRRSDVICDVMAGIGPFAIPAAQKGCKVFANDLNPDSHRYLLENVTRNKVADLVEVSNEDGRAFIRRLSGVGGPTYSQVIMNLPASAVSFLDAFRGACAANAEQWRGRLPRIHCYTFSKGDEDEAGVRQRVEQALGKALAEPPSIHFVREVAPNKRMLCVSFPLPENVAFEEAATIDAAEAAGTEPAPVTQNGTAGTAADAQAAEVAVGDVAAEEGFDIRPAKKPRT